MNVSLLLPDPLADQVGPLPALGGKLHPKVDQLQSENAQLRKRVSELTSFAREGEETPAASAPLPSRTTRR